MDDVSFEIFLYRTNYYTGILGFKIKLRQKVEVPPLEEIVYIELNGSVIELMKVKNPALQPQNQWQVGLRMIALEVEDMETAVTYLMSKGVKITRGPITLGKSKRAEIKEGEEQYGKDRRKMQRNYG